MEIIIMALLLGGFFAAQYILYRRIGLRGVVYRLSISEAEAYEGTEIEITEEIENNKRLPLLWARSEISCPEFLAFRGKSAEGGKETESRGLISGIFTLGGHKKLRRVWRVRCERRGVMRIENVVITAGDLFGMAKLALVIKTDESVRVLPSPADINAGELSGDMFIGDNEVKRFVLPDPFMISGAREYTGLEPMNRIHWLQTAKTGEIMVYKNEFTTERRVMILLNMQRKAFSMAGEMNPNVLEPQIKAAAFLLDHCLKTGAECALAANAGARLFLPAAEGFSHTVNALRALAELDNSCGEYFDVMIEKLDMSGFTDVFVISPWASERLGAALRGLSARGKLCRILTAGAFEGEENVPPECGVVTFSCR